MVIRSRCRAFTLALILLSVGTITADEAQPTLDVSLASSPPLSLALKVRPASTNWVLIERSVDLSSWFPISQLLTTNSTGPFVDRPPAEAGACFYRIRSPGVNVEQALKIWNAKKPTAYRYRFEKTVFGSNSGTLAGIVTITDGEMTVAEFELNGQTTSEFGEEEFRTPEEIFATLADAENRGVTLAHVLYDDEWGFPASTLIVQGDQLPLLENRILEFEPLPNP